MCIMLHTAYKRPVFVQQRSALMKGIQEASFKNTEAAIFPPRNHVHVISLMSGIGDAAFPIVAIFTWKGQPSSTCLCSAFMSNTEHSSGTALLLPDLSENEHQIQMSLEKWKETNSRRQ